MVSPGRSSVRQVEEMAPIPDPKSNAASAPSQAVTRSSRISLLGLLTRV